MNTSQLKQFAQTARRQLIDLVSTKLSIALDTGSTARRENEKAVKDLEKEISRTSEDQVIEKVAYIWFNRFCALRFMDVNRYTNIGVVSPAEGFSQPEILMEAKQGHIDAGLRVDKDRVFGLLNETIPSPEPQQEAYRMLLVAVCNDYNSIMPFLFEKIADYTELLMPDDLLSDSSILTATREALSEGACADVEVIGWLYQFYISEKKDEVINRRSTVSIEEIPAATQLFTPNWIVRYIVENSLGRLWMLNNPHSNLYKKMDYYVKPEQEVTDSLKISTPEEIKICDPACGSGHILVHAFELLYFIYEEEGYDAPKIPQLILEHNLYGIEIDERAGELAAFALCMKAREKYRRFFKKNVQPNICVMENITFEAYEVKSYIDAVNPDSFSMELSTLLYQFKEADNLGALIRPELVNISDVLRLIDEKKVADDIFLQGIHQRILKVLNQADYLSPKYHIVIANPPYMGTKGMNPRLKTFLQNEYNEVKSDLFSSFIVRNLELTLPSGQLGFVTPYVWMFNSSYEKLRVLLKENSTITNLTQLEYNAFEPACIPVCTFTIQKKCDANYKGAYIKLSEFRGSQTQGPKALEAISQLTNCPWFYRASSSDYGKIPSSPVAYWVSDEMGSIFNNCNALDEFNDPKQGIGTADNNRFLKQWFEVGINSIGFKYKTMDEANRSGKKWFPHKKGGPFRKWYGNCDYVLDWEKDGYEIKKLKTARPQNLQYMFKEGVTWSHTSSSSFSARYSEYGFTFNMEGPTIFSEYPKLIIGYFCSTVAMTIMQIMNPTLHFLVGSVAKLPFCMNLIQETKEEIEEIVNSAIEITKLDWNSSEISWDFPKSSLLPSECKEAKVNSSYKTLRAKWAKMTIEIKRLEEKNNTIFINSYGLQNELKSQVSLSEITLNCNPNKRYGKNKTVEEYEILLLADTIKEFISYSVGCMFGRYSLDKPGLILANQGDTIDNYLTRIPEPIFKPDDDNVIPIMDVDWFADDIAERFKRFLKVTFGEEHYTENLEFIEKALGKDIRKFFLKDFYAYHVKMYKKRPIYWIFSSPKGNFNALIYMHRYRPDTVSIILNDYLREFRTKLTARKDNLENISISTSASQGEKTKALKEIEKIKKVVDEVNEYEKDILYPLATKQIEIDLDNGVKVNYPKFGKALKKVVGLS